MSWRASACCAARLRNSGSRLPTSVAGSDAAHADSTSRITSRSRTRASASVTHAVSARITPTHSGSSHGAELPEVAAQAPAGHPQLVHAVGIDAEARLRLVAGDALRLGGDHHADQLASVGVARQRTAACRGPRPARSGACGSAEERVVGCARSGRCRRVGAHASRPAARAMADRLERLVRVDAADGGHGVPRAVAVQLPRELVVGEAHVEHLVEAAALLRIDDRARAPRPADRGCGA